MLGIIVIASYTVLPFAALVGLASLVRRDYRLSAAGLSVAVVAIGIIAFGPDTGNIYGLPEAEQGAIPRQ